VLVVVSLDPDNTVESALNLDLAALGRPKAAQVVVRDELTGERYVWGEEAFVRLYPGKPAHILHVTAE
jgi:starch synthase (maltosyl-transferring)